MQETKENIEVIWENLDETMQILWYPKEKKAEIVFRSNSDTITTKELHSFDVLELSTSTRILYRNKMYPKSRPI